MAVSSYNDIIARIGSDYCAVEPLYGEFQGTRGVIVTTSAPMVNMYDGPTTPSSLPSGVNAFVPTFVTGKIDAAINVTVMLARAINLGTLDLATNTFTDGSAYPTIKELGNNSSQSFGPVFCEITTALNATPGSFTITYIDQDNNAPETSSSYTLPTSNNGIKLVGWLNLNSTDIGVIDITGATQSGGSSPSGTLKFWGVIPLSMSSASPSLGLVQADNLLTDGFIWNELPVSTTIKGFSLASGTTSTGRAYVGALTIVGVPA